VNGRTANRCRRRKDAVRERTRFLIPPDQEKEDNAAASPPACLEVRKRGEEKERIVSVSEKRPGASPESYHILFVAAAGDAIGAVTLWQLFTAKKKKKKRGRRGGEA